MVLPMAIAVFFTIAWLIHRYVEAPSQRFGKEITAEMARARSGRLASEPVR
jgi:peptidoglycan/LPS O-acetylase OafA/YrhL